MHAIALHGIGFIRKGIIVIGLGNHLKSAGGLVFDDMPTAGVHGILIPNVIIKKISRETADFFVCSSSWT